MVSTSCRRWKAAWVRDSTECVVAREAATAVATAAIVAVKVAATATESLGHKVDSHSRVCIHSMSRGQM